MMTQEKRLAAAHEAGHAIAAVVLGAPFGAAYIGFAGLGDDPNAGESGGGMTMSADDWEDTSPRDISAVLHAGVAAENEVFGFSGYDRHSFSVDRRILAARVKDPTAVAQGRALAERIVRTHLPAVEAVAAKLAECGRLECRAVRAVYLSTLTSLSYTGHSLGAVNELDREIDSGDRVVVERNAAVGARTAPAGSFSAAFPGGRPPAWRDGFLHALRCMSKREQDGDALSEGDRDFLKQNRHRLSKAKV